MVEENSKSQKKEDDSKSNKKNEISDTKKASEFDKLMKGVPKADNTKKIVKQNESSDDQFQSNTTTSEYSENLSERISLVKEYRYASTLEIICFSLLTCGLYSYYLTYKQTEAIRKVDNQNNGLLEPILVILIMFFTCGLATFYFNYKIPERAAYISRKSGGNTNPLRKNISPPIKDLAMIGLIANLFWFFFLFITSLFSGGFALFLFYPIYIVYFVWLTYSIERSVEYMLCIREPLYE